MENEAVKKCVREPLPRDVCRVVNEIIRGNGARKTRFSQSGLEFDRRAIAAVYVAMNSIGEDIPDDTARKCLQNRVMDSVSGHIPYEHMGECYCGRQKFYDYRRELCRRVAKEMGML